MLRTWRVTQNEDGQRIVACRYGTAPSEGEEQALGATLYLSAVAADSACPSLLMLPGSHMCCDGVRCGLPVGCVCR